MSRRIRIFEALLVFAVVASACGGDTAGTTTTAPPATTTSTSTTTTTPSTSATTTSTLPAAIEIDTGTSGIQKWFPGTAYAASGFWEPVSFTTDLEGWWWAKGATELWVYVEYHEDGESGWDLDVSLIVPSPDRSPDALVLAIVADERLDVLTDPMTSTVAGHGALVLDVVAADLDVEASGIDECLDRAESGNSRFLRTRAGFVLVEHDEEQVGLGWAFGVRSCRAARIWVVDVDGSTIVIIAAAFNEELFDDLIPAADALVAGIEFHP